MFGRTLDLREGGPAQCNEKRSIFSIDGAGSHEFYLSKNKGKEGKEERKKRERGKKAKRERNNPTLYDKNWEANQ